MGVSMPGWCAGLVKVTSDKSRSSVNEVDMAFVHLLSDFAESNDTDASLKDRRRDFLESKGYKHLYETHTNDGPWYECIPVSRILGKAPLLPDWEEPAGKEPCIP
eukprot:599574-Rhodomonas_salina.1